MRRQHWAFGVSVCAAVLLLTDGASAQAPICAPPSATQVYYTGCAPGLAPRINRFLLDLSIDHSFRIVPGTISRSLFDFVRLFSGEEIPEDSTVYRVLHGLPSIDLTRFDTSTGTFSSDLTDKERELTLTPDNPFAFTSAVSVQMPEKIAGGYWRTPAVLEMAFWDRHRPTFSIDPDQDGASPQQIECLSISTAGVRIVTAKPGAPQFLLLFGNCQ